MEENKEVEVKRITNISKLSKALIEFNKEFEGLTADGKNPFFKSTYITLDGILSTVRPILAKHGLAVMQQASSEDGIYILVKTILVHESGETYETEILKMKPVKIDPQSLGSCITYCKRYQLGALLGICESIDDDGNKATNLSEKNLKNNAKVLTTVQVKVLTEKAKLKQVEDVKTVLKGFGYKTIKEILITDYAKIEEALNNLEDK